VEKEWNMDIEVNKPWCREKENTAQGKLERGIRLEPLIRRRACMEATGR